MGIKEAIYTRMTSSADLTALVPADNISENSDGVNKEEDVITYARVTTQSRGELINTGLYQISAWTKYSTTSEAIEKIIKNLFDKWKCPEAGIKYCYIVSTDEFRYGDTKEFGTHFTLKVKTFK